MDHEAYSDLFDEHFVITVCRFFCLSARMSSSMESASVQ